MTVVVVVDGRVQEERWELAPSLNGFIRGEAERRAKNESTALSACREGNDRLIIMIIIIIVVPPPIYTPSVDGNAGWKRHLNGHHQRSSASASWASVTNHLGYCRTGSPHCCDGTGTTTRRNRSWIGIATAVVWRRRWCEAAGCAPRKAWGVVAGKPAVADPHNRWWSDCDRQPCAPG